MKRTLMEKNLHVPNKREMLFGIFCWFMFIIGFSLILSLFFNYNTYEGSYYAQLAYLYGCCLLTATVFFFFLKKARMYVFPMELLKTVLIGLGAYLVLSYIVEWILLDIMIFQSFFFGKTPTFNNFNQASIDMAVRYNPVPMYIGTILAAPITEELLFRGMIFGPLCRKKPWLAYLVSTLLFALVHFISYIEYISLMNAFMLLLIYAPAGLVLGWAYQNTRSIYGPIALHCAINLFATFIG